MHPGGASPKRLGDLALHTEHEAHVSGRCRVRHQDGTEELEEWDKTFVVTANCVGGASRKTWRWDRAEAWVKMMVRKWALTWAGGNCRRWGPRAHWRRSRAVPKKTTALAEDSTGWWSDE